MSDSILQAKLSQHGLTQTGTGIIGLTAAAGLRFEVEDLNGRSKAAGLWTASGLSATLTVQADGHSRAYGLSRLDGEDGWTIDSHFRDGLPIYVNGYGSRCLRTSRIIDAHVIAALEVLSEAVAS